MSSSSSYSSSSSSSSTSRLGSSLLGAGEKGTDYYLKRGTQLGHAGGSEIQELVKPIGFKPVEKKSSGGPQWDL